LKTETISNPITVQLLPAVVYNTGDNDIGSGKVYTAVTFWIPTAVAMEFIILLAEMPYFLS